MAKCAAIIVIALTDVPLETIIRDPDRPGLTADPAVAELGEVTEGSVRSVTVKLHNHTTRPIRLVGAEAP